MSRLSYYAEALAESLAEHGIAATPEQIQAVATDMYDARQMEAEAHGDLCIPNPLRAEVEAVEAKRKKEVAELKRECEAFRKDIEARYGDRVWATFRYGRVEIEPRR